ESVNKIRGSYPKWTITHGFFALIGGFDVKEEFKSYRINSAGIADLIARGHRVIIVDKETINNKSKADIVIKGITCLQSLWLIVSSLARAFQGLLITPLELTITGFVKYTILTYLF
ncbi:hypothetical protein DL95DRAFT_314227, partial [Leptodontidium sp. 2 PMI_412]